MSPWRRLRVRDFNPYVVKRALNDPEDDGRSWYVSSYVDFSLDVWYLFISFRVVTEPTAIERGVFPNDVVSSLPFREIVSEETFEADAIMMDGERVLLEKRVRPGDPGQYTKEILVLMWFAQLWVEKKEIYQTSRCIYTRTSE
jgi:hypothetical protein